jgi:hypothetical protein
MTEAELAREVAQKLRRGTGIFLLDVTNHYFSLPTQVSSQKSFS